MFMEAKGVQPLSGQLYLIRRQQATQIGPYSAVGLVERGQLELLVRIDEEIVDLLVPVD